MIAEPIKASVPPVMLAAVRIRASFPNKGKKVDENYGFPGSGVSMDDRASLFSESDKYIGSYQKRAETRDREFHCLP